MLEFEKLKGKSVSDFKEFLTGKGVFLCNKSLIIKQMWDVFNASYAFSNGCLIVKNDSSFWGTFFDFPLLSANGNVEKALEDIEEYCMKSYTKLKFGVLTTEEKEYLTKRYPNFECFSHRNGFDYIYRGEDMRLLKGKKYNSQRNHLNKFVSLYPEAIFKKLNNSQKSEIISFLEKWKKAELFKKSSNAKYEFGVDEKFVKEADFSELCAGCIRLNGEIIAVSIGEIVYDTLIIHVEKALHEFEGVNVFMVREFAKNFPTEYVNREDDAGEEGLRISKTRYNPVSVEPEYLLEVKNECSFLKKIPVLKSERLTLTEIKKEDIKEYFRLCTDEERNEFWGYDYKKDLNGELTEDYFYKGAKYDFKNGLCVNFAIRKDGAFIGETVLYEFDYRGEVKLGVRILPEYAGNGYGEEAFLRTMKFAFYGLGIKKLNSSCYKLNFPSVKMHEKLMKRVAEDAEKYYYERKL